VAADSRIKTMPISMATLVEFVIDHGDELTDRLKIEE
jgi:hypothetical protein